MPFFTEFVGRPVVDTRGRAQGKIADMVVSADATYPIIKAVSVAPGRKGGTVVVPWEQVQSLDTTVVVRTPIDQMTAYAVLPHELYLGREVLDRQIVDVEGRKIVRVNDLQLARTNGHYRLIGVDVSSQALLRRIGVFPLTQRLGIRPQETFIAWQDVDPTRSDLNSIRLRVPQSDISRLHPADLAEIVDQLSLSESVALVQSMDAETAADTLEEMAPERTASLLQSLTSDQAADILEEMSPDDAADALGDLPEEKATELLSLMESAESADVRELLGYPEDSVGGLMTTEYVAVPQDMTAQQAIERLRQTGPDIDVIHAVYVVETLDNERLLGEMSLRDLIMADPHAPVREIMHHEPTVLHATDSPEHAARLIAKYNMIAAPVVDDTGQLLGIVSVDDAIDIILPTAWKKRLPRIFA